MKDENGNIVWDWDVVGSIESEKIDYDVHIQFAKCRNDMYIIRIIDSVTDESFILRESSSYEVAEEFYNKFLGLYR